MASTSEIQSTSSTSVIVEDNTKHVTTNTFESIHDTNRLFTLIAERNHVEIEKIAKSKDVISITDKDGNNALHIAASRDHFKAFAILCKTRLDLMSTNNDGDTPLHIAAREHSRDVLRFILKGGINVDTVNNKGITPLFIAAESGFREGVKKLVNAGANINFCDKNGLTPLFYASYFEDKCMPSLLISLGAKVQIKDKNNRTLIHRAAEAASEDCITLFIAQGVNVHDVDDFGNTALHTAIEYYDDHDKQFVYGAISVLIVAGVDPNAKNKNGETAMCIAAKKNNRSACKAITRIYNAVLTVEILPKKLENTRKRIMIYTESRRIEQECKRKRRLG